MCVSEKDLRTVDHEYAHKLDNKNTHDNVHDNFVMFVWLKIKEDATHKTKLF